MEPERKQLSHAKWMEGERNGLARRTGLQQGGTAQLLLGKEEGRDQGQQVSLQNPELLERSSDPIEWTPSKPCSLAFRSAPCLLR